VDEEGGDAAVFAVVGVGDGAAPTSRLSKLTLRDLTPFRLADAGIVLFLSSESPLSVAVGKNIGPYCQFFYFIIYLTDIFSKMLASTFPPPPLFMMRF
jgi:hypothetical protein